MGEGLRRATLEALCTRGPWKGGINSKRPWTLTVGELRAFYAAIPMGEQPMLAAIGARGMADRKADRALQLLRRAGLIEFDRSGRVWRQVGGQDG